MQNTGDGLKLYVISNEYIDYMRTKDEKILYNKNGKRPYIGIIFAIDSIDYFAPLSSPKPKHRKMKNTRDFYKLAGGKLGAINFNLMLPAVLDECFLIDIDSEVDIKYKSLLQEQIRFINKKDNRKHIEERARILYEFRKSNTYDSLKYDTDKRLFQRCCDFSLLEQAAVQYQSIREGRQEAAAAKEAGKNNKQ